MKFYLAIALTSLLLSSTSFADIYKYKNDKGSWVFTDQPRKDAVIIKPQPQNIISNNGLSNTPPATTETNTTTTNNEFTLTFKTPLNGSTIGMGEPSFTVKAELTGKAPKGTLFRLLKNGHPYMQNTATTFEISELQRGPMSLKVIAVDQHDATLAETKRITINVLRPTINNKTAKPIGPQGFKTLPGVPAKNTINNN